MNPSRGRILLCDDDPIFQVSVKHAIKGRHDCRSAFHGDEAAAILKAQPVDAVLMDIQMRTRDEGLRYLERIRETDPDLAIIMCSSLTDFGTVREAMRRGATDYLPKSAPPEEILITVEQALERRILRMRKAQQDFETRNEQKRSVMIGSSEQMEKLRELIAKVRNSSANVLIDGESGVGKELVARQLRGERTDGSPEPFVTVDAATLTPQLADSTLFGHEKGAFTGADRMMRGVFEEADGGTVFFDEIGNLPFDVQAKLLRVLQEKEVRRIGSSRAIPLRFRVVSATNRPLSLAAEAGNFKPDLLHRLSVVPIRVPPLRERPGDIPELVAHFTEHHRRSGEDGSTTPLSFTQAGRRSLRPYQWPGNIRELENLN